jgi:hypothetical protein
MSISIPYWIWIHRTWTHRARIHRARIHRASMDDRRLSSMPEEALVFSSHILPTKKPSGRERRDEDRSDRSSAIDLEPLLDSAQARAIIKMHPKTLPRFARPGRTSGVHVGKLWRFRAAEIDAWIDRQIAGSPRLEKAKVSSQIAQGSYARIDLAKAQLRRGIIPPDSSVRAHSAPHPPAHRPASPQ